jgi:hypothetical protein
MQVAGTGLLCSHLFKVKFSGSQCLGTGMTKKRRHWDNIFVFEAKLAITFLRKQIFVQLYA